MNKQISLCIFMFFFLIGCENLDIKNKENMQEIVFSVNDNRSIELIWSLPDDTLKQFDIFIDVDNLTTGEDYQIHLSQNNNYSTTIFGNPGEYKFEALWTNEYDNSVSLSISDVEITKKEEPVFIAVYMNEEVVNKYLSDRNPTEEIINADVNSGLVQYKGRVFKLPSKDLYSYLENELKCENYMLDPLETFESYEGIIFYNDSDSQQYAEDCAIVGIETESHKFIFPKGIQCDLGNAIAYERLGKPNSIDGFAIFTSGALEDFLGDFTIHSDVGNTDSTTIYRISHKTNSEKTIEKIRYEHW